MRSTLVLVERLDVSSHDDLLLVTIEGSHFLWKMVRRVVGVLVEIGRGGLEPAAAAEFLRESSAAPARLTAPASGLFLETCVLPKRSPRRRRLPVTPLPAKLTRQDSAEKLSSPRVRVVLIHGLRCCSRAEPRAQNQTNHLGVARGA